MKVYVVTFGYDYEEFNIKGIFSSHALAREFVLCKSNKAFKEVKATSGKRFRNGGLCAEYIIEEFEIDQKIGEK